MKKIVYLLSLLVLFVSCGEGGDAAQLASPGNGNPTPIPIMQAKVDNMLLELKEYKATKIGVGAKIIAFNGTKYIRINLEKLTKGTYFICTDTCKSANSASYQTSIDSFGTNTNGKVDITVFDEVNQTITGRFYFKSFTSNGKPADITTGVFNKLIVN